MGPVTRVVLHVGLPKTGTTYLQALLADHRDELRDSGVLYPFLRPGGMFHAAVEVRGSHGEVRVFAGGEIGKNLPAFRHQADAELRHAERRQRRGFPGRRNGSIPRARASAP